MKIRTKLILLITVAMFILTLSMGFMSLIITRDVLNMNIESKLEVAVLGYHSDVQYLKDRGIDITVFEGDTRIESSIEGAVGSKASDIVIEKVLKGRENYFDTKVNVNGEPYYGYYMPTEQGMVFAGQPSENIQKSINTLAIAIFGIAGFILILCSAAAVFVAIRISNKIIKINTVIKKVAEGHLNVPMNGIKDSRDELGEMKNSLKLTLAELSEVIGTTTTISGEVLKSSEELNATAEQTLSANEEISKVIEEVANSATEQSGAVQNIAENLSLMDNSINNIKESIQEIGKQSDGVSESSNIMNGKMDLMAKGSERMNSGVNNISEKINSVSQVVNRVQGIIDIIEDIANQTKLLSLNAMIESARAGEAGRGFAVVAETIKTMSESTETQVNEIKEIITGLVTECQECSKSVDEVVIDNEEQKKEIQNVISEFTSLDEKIVATGQSVAEIKALINKVADLCNSVAADSEELSAISQSNAASTEEMNANVEELNAMMNGVDNTAKLLEEKSKHLSDSLGFFIQ